MMLAPGGTEYARHRRGCRRLCRHRALIAFARRGYCVGVLARDPERTAGVSGRSLWLRSRPLQCSSLKEE